MKNLKQSNRRISTILAFCLIPITGLALDIYLPSLPNMSMKMRATPAALQLSVSIFLATYGTSQLLVGGLLDSYGRFWPNIIALTGFSLASFVIATTESLQMIYYMRAIQGTMCAFIIVSKRAFFVDVFSGVQLKRYTSLFSIIWSIAPIIAPFAGGYLQIHFGWQSNFYFLGCFGLVFLLLELIFSGETLDKRIPFRLTTTVATYRSMLGTWDFTSGMLVLGLSYGVLMVYNMSSPFLIGKIMHYPVTMTGSCSMISGLSMLSGGLISRALISKPFFKKLLLTAISQLVLTVALILLTLKIHNLYTLIAYVIFLHSAAGFIFNGMLAYCLTRFSHNAGMASGLAGGGYIISTSVFSYLVVNLITIDNQASLGVGYAVLILGVGALIFCTKWIERGGQTHKTR